MLISSTTNKKSIVTAPASPGGIRRELGVCGIANIPNQIHHVASHTPYSFNILLAGPVSVGKTCLINRILGQPVFKNESRAFLDDNHACSVAIRVRQQELCERDVRATIRVIDVPQLGYAISKRVGTQALLNYARLMLKQQKDAEEAERRSLSDCHDGRIHVCLYFLTPSQSALSQTDLDSLQALAHYTSLILVVPKSDLLSEPELRRLSAHCLAQCEQHNIPLFINELIATSSRQSKAGLLEESLIKQHLPVLIDRTSHIYYEKYRSALLLKRTTGSLEMQESFQAVTAHPE